MLYRKYAWLQDEVRPLSGGVNNPFGGWAATLVDSLGLSQYVRVYNKADILSIPRYTLDHGHEA